MRGVHFGSKSLYSADDILNGLTYWILDNNTSRVHKENGGFVVELQLFNKGKSEYSLFTSQKAKHIRARAASEIEY